ncbi:hypothetical protein [Kribbella sp. CA-247076]|uniref:hypothetical protein n=1 Tax=Kribbella sp. CA-247076 TaxID=3239941 RepID=UPI003D8E72D7
MKQVLMTGPAWVSYAQIYVESTDEFADLRECFAGQRNGLCGAAVPGNLFLITGLHTGDVGFTVELHDRMPSVEYDAEEVVEASYRPRGEVALVGWGGGGRWPLELVDADYRVRYSAWGMDAGHQAGPPMEDEPLVDRYLLQFWPAPPAPDRVVKQTSAQAAYRHDFARKQPTPAEFAQQKLERARKAEDQRLAEEAAAWGGAAPTERLREVSWTARELAQRDRPLADALESASPDTQRAVARWSARRALVEAGMSRRSWVASALDGMDRGADLWGLLQAPAEDLAPGELRIGLAARPWGWDDDLDPLEKLSTMLTAAYEQDPLRAAIDTIVLTFGAFGDGRQAEVIREVRQAFPEL